MNDIYKDLDDIKTKIKIVRYFIAQIALKVNELWILCENNKDKFDKLSDNEKKQLEKMSVSIFTDLGNAMHELTSARLNAYDISEFLLVE